MVERAIAAALAVAKEQSLRVSDAAAIGVGSNVIVHLRPNPVVARVMSGTVVLHSDPHEWLTREIDVGRFLAARGTGIVAPTTLVEPGPHLRDGLWISLWEYVEVRETPLEATAIGRALRSLHDDLAEYPGPLPPRSEVLGEIDWLLAALSDEPGIVELRAERDRLADVIASSDANPQPIHGDASLSALLATPSGPRWNDFEDVCLGAVEWDVAGLVSDARAAHGDEFAAGILEAYGREFDPVALERVNEVHDLYGDLWRRYRRKRDSAAD